MRIIGCDYLPRFQQIAFANTEGRECGHRRLQHVAEAEQFYRALAGQAVRAGMEAAVVMRAGSNSCWRSWPSGMCPIRESEPFTDLQAKIAGNLVAKTSSMGVVFGRSRVAGPGNRKKGARVHG